MHNENDPIDERKLKTLLTEGGFITPIGYFENMRKHVLQHTTQQQIEETFNVPDGYFEQSRIAILAQTVNSPQTVRLWYTRPFVKYAAAAIVVLASTLTFWVNKPQPSKDLQSMSDEEIILYFDEQGVRDIPVSEVSFAVNETPANSEEKYLMNNADEQSIIEEL